MRLTAVAGKEVQLEHYPIGREERLDAHAFVKWHYHRWLSSRSFRLASWEAQGMMRALFDMCQTESPIGTLPNDDDELAVMLRVDRRRVQELRTQEFGPLRGWQLCLCDDEVRLMHPVVLEQVRDALARRDARELSREAAAERKRRERLRQGLMDLGLTEGVVSDDLLIERMDAWMLANVRGRRAAHSYAAALLHAKKERWL
ncbi:hypothetical protein C8J27_106179 [Rhodobacter aestuarii]|uniref:Uncharacterized protein n=1 Tax=Rhodobacter aestuarii TaxID=453582 RepID=A0A1N7M840_9RHOB|nr:MULTISPECIES: hypothetical protein [Rhodobacter]PTV94910.1 hypothetical protein C8J27_106179 [Rhodobacter aestuarii]SIS82250.1 hypothetical protein SAMN05421580_105179 [Rhodobacter aestuarii]SOC13821.1 hypothetical protein SAMN05877809_10720 [Rhodobacter sp. JA431]